MFILYLSYQTISSLLKSLYPPTGFCAHQNNEPQQHIHTSTNSYNQAVYVVLRCTGGFCYTPIPNGKGVRMMLSIKEQKRIQCRFAAFCKVVFRNAVCTYFRDLDRKRKREISLEYLYEQTHFEAHSTDDYFVRFDTPTDFTVYGQLVTIDVEYLANALLCLSEKRREIILLRYYLHFNDVQIATLYGSPRTTVNYQRQAALKQLRKEMEGMKDEI